VRPDRLLAAQLEKLSAKHTGAGAEQDREEPLPLINTDHADQEKSKTFNHEGHEGTQRRKARVIGKAKGQRPRAKSR
jgi:hypothetical protein